MQVQHLAAFSRGDHGGNPAGVCVGPSLPSPAEMQSIARQVGYSETVFAARGDGGWITRYYSPEAEVPFCGHATIALAAYLAHLEGDGAYWLQLAHDRIQVKGKSQGQAMEASFVSPPSGSRPAEPAHLRSAFELFGLSAHDIDPHMAPAVISAGAPHLLLPLRTRALLSGMRYDFSRGQAMMREHGWVTIALTCREGPARFSARNAFAYGGVYEDPATGAAAAALAGYLRHSGEPAGLALTIEQGADMGTPCRLQATTPDAAGGRVAVSGSVRFIAAAPR